MTRQVKRIGLYSTKAANIYGAISKWWMLEDGTRTTITQAVNTIEDAERYKKVFPDAVILGTIVIAPVDL